MMIKVIKKSMLVFLLFGIALMFIMAMSTSSSVAYAAEVEETEEVVEETEESSWSVWFEEKLLPGIILVVTGVCTIYLAISPILYKVKNASDKFKEATSDISTTATKGKENTESINVFKEEIKKIVVETMKELLTNVNSLNSNIEGIKTNIKNTEEIVRIAFCNTDELVKKGYANEISKVGAKNEETELEKQTNNSTNM